MTLWAIISVWMPWILAGILLICVLTLAVLLIRKRKKLSAARAGEKTPQATENPRTQKKQLRQDIRQAINRLRMLSDPGSDAYDVPWIMVFGLDDAETSHMLQAVAPEEKNKSSIIPRAGTIHFCRNGVLFQAGQSLLDQVNGSRLWQMLICILRGCRPHRPVDGLVITLPVSKLIGSGALAYDRLADYGSRINEMIIMVQRRTGLRVPVTLVLTGCEQLQGFRDFTTALPPQARKEALGWASPYALDHVFMPEWTAEALEHIATDLTHVITQQLMLARGSAVTDTVVILPPRIRALRDRLTPMLAGIFQPSAYHETFLFRGIYLTGNDNLPGTSGAFVEGLFNNKIFREFQLVKPVRGVLTRRTRYLRITQSVLACVAILGLISLFWLHADIRDRAKDLDYLMNAIYIDLNLDNGQLHRANVRQDSGKMLARTNARYLLDALARLNVTGLNSPLAPTSYLSHPNDKLQNALTTGFNAVIMSEINQNMVTKLYGILHCGNAGNRSLQDLHSYVADLVAYSQARHEIQSMKDNKCTQDLAAAAQYALNITVPENINHHARLYERAMTDANIPNYSKETADITGSLEAHFLAVYRAQFNDAKLMERQKRIRDTLKRAERSDPRTAFLQIKKLHEDLDSITAMLNSDSYSWINGDAANLGPALEADLSQLKNTDLVDSGEITHLHELGENQIKKARQALLGKVSTGTVALLKNDNGKITLTADMVKLAGQLDAFMAQRFMSEDVPTLSQARGSKPVLWLGSWLKAARQLAQTYQTYTEKNLGLFSEDLRQSISLAASYGAQQHVRRAIIAAARPWAEVSARPYDMTLEFDSLHVQEQVLDGLELALDQADFHQGQLELKHLLVGQTERLLKNIDTRAVQYALLAPPDSFSWWDGTPSLALKTYSVTNPATLKQMLATSFSNISELATGYAAPLITIHNTVSDETGPEVTRWQEILRAVNQFKKKTPVSSIRKAEDFILGQMMDVDTASCNTLQTDSSQSDPFSANLAAMEQAIRTRCTELQQDALIAGYSRLHTVFNQTLADHFPFSAHAKAPFADPEDVRSFFRQLNQEHLNLTDDSAKYIGQTATTFLTRVQQDKTALGPMLEDDTRPLPLRYVVQAKFRTNASVDVGGNQIILWGLDFGATQQLSSRKPGGTAIWSSGEPARLYVQFASNAPSLPASDSSGAYHVSGRRAIWEAKDPWALLSLIARLTPVGAAKAALPDQLPQTLALSVLLKPNPQAAKGAKSLQQAKLYLQLRLSVQTKQAGKPAPRTALILPYFPNSAPVPEPPKSQHETMKLVPSVTQDDTKTHLPRVL